MKIPFTFFIVGLTISFHPISSKTPPATPQEKQDSLISQSSMPVHSNNKFPWKKAETKNEPSMPPAQLNNGNKLASTNAGDNHIDAPLTKNVTNNASSSLTVQNSKAIAKTLTLHNAITNDMATYKKHWSGNHTPEWKLLVNKQPIELDKTTTLEISNNKIDVEFVFDFYVLGKSYQKGSAVATFEIPETITHMDIEFSWDKSERLMLINKTPNASAVQPLLLTYNEKK